MPYLVDKLKIDSVFFPTNSTALPGIQILYDQYIKKGKDISVICFDDNDFFKVLQTTSYIFDTAYRRNRS